MPVSTALVTGSAGFVGRHMAGELSNRGWGVVECDIVPGPACASIDALELFRVDTWSYDLVVHAAARSPHRAAIDGDPGMHPYNAMLDAAMFDWAIRTGQRRVLYLSSCAALDGPVDDYAATKLTGERLAANARAAGVPVTVVRPYSGYGEDQGTDWPYGAFAARARRIREAYATAMNSDDVELFEIWGDGCQVRDWIHVDDVVAGALAVVESGTEDAVSLCTGVGTSMFDLACMMCDQAGIPRKFNYLDKLAGVSHRIGNPSRLHEIYTPAVGLAAGVKRTLG